MENKRNDDDTSSKVLDDARECRTDGDTNRSNHTSDRQCLDAKRIDEDDNKEHLESRADHRKKPAAQSGIHVLAGLQSLAQDEHNQLDDQPSDQKQQQRNDERNHC